MNDRYELHSRIQDAVLAADVGFKNFKFLRFLAYTTFYQFIREPSLTRERSLSGIRLVTEFLEAAVDAHLLPVARENRKDKGEILEKLYNQWWGNNKSFVAKEPEHVE